MSDDSTGAVVTAKVGAGALRPGLVVTEIQGIPHAMVADDVKLHNLENLLPQPSRITGERAFEEPDSFSAYVEQFKDEKTRVFGWPDKFLFNAIIDDHQRKPCSAGSRVVRRQGCRNRRYGAALTNLTRHPAVERTRYCRS